MSEKLNFITDTKGIESTTLKQLNDAGIETIDDIDPMDADDIVNKVNDIDHATAFKIIKSVEEHKTDIDNKEVKSKSVNVDESEDLDIEDDVNDVEEDFLDDIENEEVIDKYEENEEENNEENEQLDSKTKEKTGIINKILGIFIKEEK